MSQTATTTQEAGTSRLHSIELHRLPSTASRDRSTSSQPKGNIQPPAEAEVGTFDGGGEPPADAQGQVERWNYPRSNVLKLGFAFFSFVIAGMNDGAVGVCISSNCKHEYPTLTILSRR
jgi:hypothetical protein